MNIVDRLLGITLFGAEWVLWLLLILSAVSLGIIIDRVIYFWRNKQTGNIERKVAILLAEGNMAEAEKLCGTDSSLIAACLRKGFEHKDRGVEAMQKVMEGFLVTQRSQMDRGLTFLGTLGNNAPFIGLFGTVIGIIQAFHDLSNNPEGGPQVVMAGISEALVATAVGLFVAIPAVIAFNYFNRIIKTRINSVEAIKKLI